MARFLRLLAFIIVVKNAFSIQIPQPGELALVFNEDDFEEYLDNWLEMEEQKGKDLSRIYSTSGMTKIILI